MSSSEKLFDLEYRLRVAAKSYAQVESESNRLALRKAARNFADAADSVDEDVDLV